MVEVISFLCIYRIICIITGYERELFYSIARKQIRVNSWSSFNLLTYTTLYQCMCGISSFLVPRNKTEKSIFMLHHTIVGWGANLFVGFIYLTILILSSNEFYIVQIVIKRKYGFVNRTAIDFLSYEYLLH